MNNRFSRRHLLSSVPAAGAAWPSSPAGAGQAAGSAGRPEARDLIVAQSQLGYRPGAPKTVSLAARESAGARLPARIPYYVMKAGSRLPRRFERQPAIWKQAIYQWPFDLLDAPLAQPHEALRKMAAWSGELVRRDSRWGPFWQADFSGLKEPGLYQIETEFQLGTPFAVDDRLYDALVRGYLNYVHAQRSGVDVFGVRTAVNADDGVLDSTGEPVPAAGGWNDAGDTRKWMTLTAFHVEGLAAALACNAELRPRVLDEIHWGNRWLHGMISPEGQVYEDIGGGVLRGGGNYEQGWWNENHPGCLAGNAKNDYTDGRPLSGDERPIRTTYNPWAYFTFVRMQAIAARLLDPPAANRCLHLAGLAWKYVGRKGDDDRTLFLAGRILAALELWRAGRPMAGAAELDAWVETLLARQDRPAEGGAAAGLSHYFLEADGKDAFRSVGFSCEPPLALLRYAEHNPNGNQALRERCRTAVRQHIERYLLADARSNPYGVTPYGAYVRQPHPDQEVYRDAGRGRGVRTFIHPYNDQFMPHGTNSVVLQQAHLLARAAAALGEPAFGAHAEVLIQWVTGHNPTGLSMHNGVGYRHQTAFSIRCFHRIPDAVTAGFIGRPDDTPYLETSNVLQWSTQEIWGVPAVHLTLAVAALLGGRLP